MSNTLLDIIQSALHGASLALIGITVVLIVIGCLKPQLFKLIFQEFSERKYIISGGVFLVLLSGTIFIATEPMHNQTLVSNNDKQAIETVESLEPETKQQEAAEIRVEDIVTTEPIAFTQQQQADPTLPKGQTKIIQTGVAGQHRITHSVTYKDNVETSRVLKEDVVSVAPVAEITAIGSQEPVAPPPATITAPAPAAEKQSQKSITVKGCENSKSWICSLFSR